MWRVRKWIHLRRMDLHGESDIGAHTCNCLEDRIYKFDPSCTTKALVGWLERVTTLDSAHDHFFEIYFAGSPDFSSQYLITKDEYIIIRFCLFAVAGGGRRWDARPCALDMFDPDFIHRRCGPSSASITECIFFSDGSKRTYLLACRGPYAYHFSASFRIEKYGNVGDTKTEKMKVKMRGASLKDV